MVRLPIHSLRRPSAVPASDISPTEPHPTGSPPPNFTAFSGHARDEKDIGGGSIAVTRTAEVDIDAPPAPAYSPPRRSRSIHATDAHGGSMSQHYTRTGHGPQVKVEMGAQDMKQMVIEDYHAIKHFCKHVKWREVWPKVVARTMWKWYAIIAVAITLTVLVTTQHDAVVKYCAPVTRKIRSWPAGWMIPLVLLIIVSYPPLVGHEIIGILIGLVWGLGEGFAILAAGTFIGEILLWFSFKWCCTNAASKFERKNKLYWSLTQLIREKTFMFVLILRFSAIPGHIVTAVSASAGANYWSYLAAAFLTLPKQFTIVYLGSAFGHKEKKHVIISTVTMITTIVVTGVAAVYVYYQMRMVMKRREAEMAEALPTHRGDLAMVETGPGAGSAGTAEGAAPGTWAGVALAQPTNGDDKRSDLEVYVPELDKNEMRGLAARRPWLFTNPSFSSSITPSTYGNGNGAGSRAWSVPHHMTESEMKEFQLEMESGAATPLPYTANEGAPAFGNSFSDSPPSPLRTRHSPTESVPPRDWDLLAPPTGSQRASSSSERSASRDTHRSTASLDLARSPVLSPSGGRELADEADRYAYERGGRRPDYNRMRGESRAALLGRPADDASSLKSGNSEQ